MAALQGSRLGLCPWKQVWHGPGNAPACGVVSGDPEICKLHANSMAKSEEWSCRNEISYQRFERVDILLGPEGKHGPFPRAVTDLASQRLARDEPTEHLRYSRHLHRSRYLENELVGELGTKTSIGN